MTKRSEGHFKSIDGIDLFFQHWERRDPVGTIIVTHGLGEHSECYEEFAERLAAKKWNVVAWDLRGHGRSCGQRGYVDSFSDFEMDLSTLIQNMRDSEKSPEPFVLFGHSMGALVTLRHLLTKDPSHYLAACLSSPLLGIAVDVPRWKKKFAETVGNLVPKLTLNNEIKYEHLVRDPAHIATYYKDPLRQNRISPKLFLGIIKNYELTLEQAARIELPLSLQISGHDKIVNASQSRKLYSSINSKVKEFHEYPQSMHEIFNDLDKDQVFSDLYGFLDKVTK